MAALGCAPSNGRRVDVMKERKQFRCGLVVGKFCPLHLGHMFLIQSALAACDEVIVISYTKPDFHGWGRAIRESWIKNLLPQVRTLVVDDETLVAYRSAGGSAAYDVIPHNDAPDEIHRDFTGWLCWTVLSTTVDAVFTSEEYGDGLASALSVYFASRSPDASFVKHICVDRARIVVPISGTAIRDHPRLSRNFLDPRVYASLVKRVCILGGESSGKTSLARTLAARLETVWVPEFGREHWELKGGRLQFDDMLYIAEVQAKHESTLAGQADQWLICDTSALVTAFYSFALFGKIDPRLTSFVDLPYAVTFLCMPDFPFVQDGTRRDDMFRWRQHQWYRDELDKKGIAYTVLHGTLESRVRQAVERLNECLPEHLLA